MDFDLVFDDDEDFGFRLLVFGIDTGRCTLPTTTAGTGGGGNGGMGGSGGRTLLSSSVRRFFNLADFVFDNTRIQLSVNSLQWVITVAGRTKTIRLVIRAKFGL